MHEPAVFTTIIIIIIIIFNIISNIITIMIISVVAAAAAKVHMGEMSEPPAPALSEHKMRRMVPTIVKILPMT